MKRLKAKPFTLIIACCLQDVQMLAEARGLTNLTDLTEIEEGAFFGSAVESREVTLARRERMNAFITSRPHVTLYLLMSANTVVEMLRHHREDTRTALPMKLTYAVDELWVVGSDGCFDARDHDIRSDLRLTIPQVKEQSEYMQSLPYTTWEKYRDVAMAIYDLTTIPTEQAVEVFEQAFVRLNYQNSTDSYAQIVAELKSDMVKLGRPFVEQP